MVSLAEVWRSLGSAGRGGGAFAGRDRGRVCGGWVVAGGWRAGGGAAQSGDAGAVRSGGMVSVALPAAEVRAGGGLSVAAVNGPRSTWCPVRWTRWTVAGGVEGAGRIPVDYASHSGGRGPARPVARRPGRCGAAARTCRSIVGDGRAGPRCGLLVPEPAADRSFRGRSRTAADRGLTCSWRSARIRCSPPASGRSWSRRWHRARLAAPGRGRPRAEAERARRGVDPRCRRGLVPGVPRRAPGAPADLPLPAQALLAGPPGRVSGRRVALPDRVASGRRASRTRPRGDLAGRPRRHRARARRLRRAGRARRRGRHVRVAGRSARRRFVRGCGVPARLRGHGRAGAEPRRRRRPAVAAHHGRLRRPARGHGVGVGLTLSLEQPDLLHGMVDVQSAMDGPARARLAAALSGTTGEDQLAVRASGLLRGGWSGRRPETACGGRAAPY